MSSITPKCSAKIIKKLECRIKLSYLLTKNNIITYDTIEHPPLICQCNPTNGTNSEKNPTIWFPIRYHQFCEILVNYSKGSFYLLTRNFFYLCRRIAKKMKLVTMRKEYDYPLVGTGLFNAVFAYLARLYGKRSLVIRQLVLSLSTHY